MISDIKILVFLVVSGLNVHMNNKYMSTDYNLHIFLHVPVASASQFILTVSMSVSMFVFLLLRLFLIYQDKGHKFNDAIRM